MNCKLNPTIHLIGFLSCVYSLMYLPVVIFNETLPTVAAEEGELLVVLPLVPVPMTLQVESLTTDGAHEGLIFSLPNTVGSGKVCYQVGCVVLQWLVGQYYSILINIKY